MTMLNDNDNRDETMFVTDHNSFPHRKMVPCWWIFCSTLNKISNMHDDDGDDGDDDGDNDDGDGGGDAVPYW